MPDFGRGNTIRHDTSQRHAGKYQNCGLIHQIVLGRFLDAIANHIQPFQSSTVLDFGCGECFFWQEMQRRGIEMQNLTGIDLRDDALNIATEHFPEHSFLLQDVLTYEASTTFDLVIASQVLEHLPEPEIFLAKLISLVKPGGQLVLSVPWEPFFMLSNLARGRDILRMGNHPEHVNLWSKRKFEQLVSSQADVLSSASVFPFIILVAAPK